MTKKKGAQAVTILFGENHACVLNKERVVIDNQNLWHFRINNGNRANMLADGDDDGVVVTTAGARHPGQITWADVRDTPAKVERSVGSRGLEFLQTLMRRGDLSAVEELHIVSAWQIKIVLFRGKWANPDKLVLPALRKALGRRVVVENWNVPDSEVTRQ